MATENRTPDDLQEAVAATLRRLRGEVGKPGTTPAPAAAAPAARTEPQLSAAAPEQPAPVTPPAAKQEIIEPDLLSRTEPEIPMAPAAAKLGAEQYRLETPRNRTRVLPYALSMVAILVFAGIVWWAYQAIVAGPNKGPVPTIAADSNPAKVPPSDQQSTETTGQQQTVYDQISGTNSQPKTEVLLPTPEVPQTPPPPPTPVPSTTDAGTTTTDTGTATAPAPAPAPAASTDSGTATQTLVPPPAPLAPATTEGSTASTTASGATTSGTASTDTSTAATGSTSTTATASTDTSSSTTSGSATSATTTTADTGSTATQPASGTDTGSTTGTDTGAANTVTTNPSTDAGDLYGVPTLAPTTPAASTAPATTASTTTTTVASTDTSAAAQPAATADFRIQLAALKSEGEANSAWKRIQSKHIDVLGSLSVHIVRADLGAQGIYYRVQAGPFPDKASAVAACDKLKSSGQQCLVKP